MRAMGVFLQLSLEVLQAEQPSMIHIDTNHIDLGLAPGQLVGMVLIRADEHHRALSIASSLSPAQHVDQTVNGAGGT